MAQPTRPFDDASATGTSQSEPSTGADADRGSTTTDGDQTTTGETSADEAPSGTDSTEEAPATTAGVSTTVGGSDTTQPGDGILLAVLIIAADGDLDKALDAGLITEEDIETALKAIASGDLDSYISDS